MSYHKQQVVDKMHRHSPAPKRLTLSWDTGSSSLFKPVVLGSTQELVRNANS